MARILLVDSHPGDGRSLAAALRAEGHATDVVGDGRDAITGARDRSPDLVLLDLALRDGGGYTALRSLRQESATLPVLVLSQAGTEAERVLAFQLGADGFITKPYAALEVLAQIEGQLRRVAAFLGAHAHREIYRFGEVVADARARTVHRAGREVRVSPRAFDLLLALLRSRGDALSRQQLLRDVWGHLGAVQTRTIDQHIRELRQKLEENPANPRYVLTSHKSGYRFASE